QRALRREDPMPSDAVRGKGQAVAFLSAHRPWPDRSGGLSTPATASTRMSSTHAMLPAAVNNRLREELAKLQEPTTIIVVEARLVRASARSGSTPRQEQIAGTPRAGGWSSTLAAQIT